MQARTMVSARAGTPQPVDAQPEDPRLDTPHTDAPRPETSHPDTPRFSKPYTDTSNPNDQIHPAARQGPPAAAIQRVDIRLATKADREHIVEILTLGFWDEDAISWMSPHRDEFPDDMKKFWRRSLRPEWPVNRFMVAVLTKEHKEAGKVVGVANWRLRGAKISTRTFPVFIAPTPTELSIVQKICVHLANCQNLKSEIISPNRATDKEKLRAGMETLQLADHHWSGSRSFSWELKNLAVEKTYRGRTIATQLVKWGMAEASNMGVSASVVSAYQKDNFYRTCGFDVVVGNITEGENNPFRVAGVRGGTIFFKDPPLFVQDSSVE
jgi:hypothetical protein